MQEPWSSCVSTIQRACLQSLRSLPRTSRLHKAESSKTRQDKAGIKQTINQIGAWSTAPSHIQSDGSKKVCLGSSRPHPSLCCTEASPLLVLVSYFSDVRPALFCEDRCSLYFPASAGRHHVHSRFCHTGSVVLVAASNFCPIFLSSPMASFKAMLLSMS